MNVCIVTSSFPRNRAAKKPAGNFIPDFTQKLKHCGHTPFVFTQGDGSSETWDGVYIERYNWGGDEKPVGSLKLWNPYDFKDMVRLFWRGIRCLKSFIRDHEIKYCLACWAVPAGLITRIAVKHMNIPFATWCLGSDINTYGQKPLIGSLVRYVIEQSDIVFADGFELCKKVGHMTGKKAVFLPSTRNILNLKEQEPPVDSQTIKFLFIGRWERVKGIDCLLDAALILRDRHPEISFHLVGGGSMKPGLSSIIEKHNLHGYITLYDEISGELLKGFLKEADCLVIPSRSESIPVILHEAFQMGLPVVASDVGDMGYILNTFNAGILVEPGNAQALAAGLESFVKKGKLHFQKNVKDALQIWNDTILKEFAKYLSSREKLI